MVTVYLLLGVGALAFWLSPLVAGLLDCWWWLMTSHQLTGIAWNGERVWFVFLWLLLAALPFVILVSFAFEAADKAQVTGAKKTHGTNIKANR